MATGLNSRGEVVGYSFVGAGHEHGFLFDQGTYSRIDVPMAEGLTYPTCINSRGEIVGSYSAANTSHGFLLSQGVYTTVDPPGAKSGFGAAGINDRGEIVGNYESGTGTRGYVLDHGVYKTLAFPGAQDTEADGITSEGWAFGWFAMGKGPKQGFLWSQGVYSRIAFPNATSTTPACVNGQGQVVGEYSDRRSHSHGFLSSHGVYSTLDIPHTAGTVAVSINDHGQVVGDVSYTRLSVHGFLLAHGMNGFPASLAHQNPPAPSIPSRPSLSTAHNPPAKTGRVSGTHRGQAQPRGVTHIEAAIGNGRAAPTLTWLNHRLLNAVTNKRTAAVLAILREGANVNAYVNDLTGEEMTPLGQAIVENDESIARLLISHGADVNGKNGYEQPPLYFALGHPRLVSLLLAHGANPNSSYSSVSEDSVFMAAAASGDMAGVKLMLTHGARVNWVGRFGGTVLDRVAQYLLQDSSGRSVARQRLAILRLLKRHGARLGETFMAISVNGSEARLIRREGLRFWPQKQLGAMYDSQFLPRH